MIKLGMRVKDKISGFEGIAVAYTVWLYGCKRIAVKSTELKDGKPIDEEWFDEQQLEEIETKKITFGNQDNRGGPQKDPKNIRQGE